MSQPETSAPSKPNAFIRLSAMAAGATILGSFVGIATNYLILDSWGLPYSLVATPSDIIVGFIEAVPAVLVLVTAVVVAVFIAQDLELSDEKLKTTRLLLKVLFGLFFLLVFAQMIVPDKYLFRKPWGEPDIFKAVINTVLLGIAICIAILLRRYGSNKFAEIGVAALLLAGFLNTMAVMPQRNLMQLKIESHSERCNGNEYVAWAGSSSIVTSCKPPPFSKGDEFFIEKRDSQVVVVTRERTD